MGPTEHDGQVGLYDFLSHKPICEIIQSLQLEAILSKKKKVGARFEDAQLMHTLRHNHRNFHFIETNWTLSVIIAAKISHELLGECAPFAFREVLNKVVDINLSILLR